MTKPNKYNDAAARQPEQLAKMKDLAKRDLCIFCYETVNSEADNPIELDETHWYVKKNDYPYKNTVHHWLVVPKVHVRSLSELPVDAQRDFVSVINRLATKHNLTSYAVGLRSGDMRYNGGSVEHLHAHVVVGDTDDPLHQPVRFKMSSRP